MNKHIQDALEEIRPLLNQDGGDIELVKFEDDIAYVKFKGTCKGCPFSLITLHFSVEEIFKKNIPGFKKVVLL